jgi:hypothetical protein
LRARSAHQRASGDECCDNQYADPFHSLLLKDVAASIQLPRIATKDSVF